MSRLGAASSSTLGREPADSADSGDGVHLENLRGTVMCYVEHQSFGVIYGPSIRGPVMFWRRDDLLHDARHFAGEVLQELVERRNVR